METSFIEFFYSGLYRSADIGCESNPYHIKYTVKMSDELAILMNLDWMEITYEQPVTWFDGQIIAPTPEMSFSDPLIENVEFVDEVLKALWEKEGNEE